MNKIDDTKRKCIYCEIPSPNYKIVTIVSFINNGFAGDTNHPICTECIEQVKRFINEKNKWKNCQAEIYKYMFTWRITM